MNSAAVNIIEYAFWWNMLSIYLEVEMWGHGVCVCLAPVDNAKCFLKKFIFPSAAYENFHWSISLPTLGIASLLYCGHLLLSFYIVILCPSVFLRSIKIVFSFELYTSVSCCNLLRLFWLNIISIRLAYMTVFYYSSSFDCCIIVHCMNISYLCTFPLMGIWTVAVNGYPFLQVCSRTVQESWNSLRNSKETWNG